MKKQQTSMEEIDSRIVVNTRSESEPIMVFAEYLPTGEIVVRLVAKEGERVRTLNEAAEVFKSRLASCATGTSKTMGWALYNQMKHSQTLADVRVPTWQAFVHNFPMADKPLGTAARHLSVR